ncbi:MAG TPA: triple tyrosine motif-containing protein, partial [Bacteroidota bacterium]|nr:triple tyrosine motif-containing protein [Bacteroidota bacterium]
VMPLCEDQSGTLWVGTDVGLFRYNRDSADFSLVPAARGPETDNIPAMLEDGRGHLWLCTVHGLCRFDPRTGTLRSYDSEDGVTMGSTRIPVAYKSRTGEMFFGGSNGFIRFSPDSIRDNLFIPPVVITGFKVFDKAVPLDSAISEKRAIELSYKDNVFSFEFAALSYTCPAKNHYAFKLEGFDADWVYCGTRRYATYTNLGGGHYTFRVKGSNNDGVWNETGASIAFFIAPPFWETWWFRIFAFFGVLGSVGGSIRYVEMRKLKRRIEQLEHERALERERARISQDMHDEVGSSLSEIAILSELAKKKPEESETHVQEISNLASELIDSVSEIVWAMNPRNDTLDNLVAHLRRYSVKYLNPAGIACQFSAPDVIPAYHLSAETRRNIFLIAKEALHNVVKHAGASRVEITVTLERGTMEIMLGDNGRGFVPAENASSGNGLPSMQTRAESIGGLFTIGSEPGRGTRLGISVTLPVPEK